LRTFPINFFEIKNFKNSNTKWVLGMSQGKKFFEGGNWLKFCTLLEVEIGSGFVHF
jgi:hypothetical protein